MQSIKLTLIILFGSLRCISNIIANDYVSYRGDHTETIDIDYDPEKVTYRELLDLFWKSHDPTAKTTLQVC
jgi:peptide methionine sulfoxide reductase MsrA